MAKRKAKNRERTFFIRKFTVTVLSEDPIPEDSDLQTIHYNITEGSCSGVVEPEDQRVVDGPVMARLLRNQGSDPAFFGLNEDGSEVLPCGDKTDIGVGDHVTVSSIIGVYNGIVTGIRQGAHCVEVTVSLAEPRQSKLTTITVPAEDVRKVEP